MQLVAEGVVTGFTKFKGDIDGQAIDSNTVFVEVSIGSMGKGTRTTPRKCQDAQVLDKIAHLPLPFTARLVMEEQATAKRESIVVLEIQPLKPAAKAA